MSCDLAGPALARPARLSPLQADTLLLAIELVGNQLPTASGAALESAAEKLRAARGGAPALVGSDLLLPADEILAAVNRAIVERRLLAIQYWTEGTDRMTDRVVEPYLLVHSRGEWYYVCWCRTAGGTRVFRVATTKCARLLDETFEPRAGRRARPVPARGHPDVRQLRAPGGDRLVQPDASPAGSPSGSRWSCSRTARASRASPTWTCAGSPPTCSASPTRRARWTRREAVEGVRAVVRRLLGRYA